MDVLNEQENGCSNMSYIKQLYKQPFAFIKSPIINFLKDCIGPKSIIKKKKIIL